MTEHAPDFSVPLLVHVPHASSHVPERVRDQFPIPDHELHGELLALTDWYTDELFETPPRRGTTIRFPVSRFVVDPERFEVDSMEPMAACGMGVIYTRGVSGRPVRRELSDMERDALLDTWYRPHWALMESTVDRMLDRHDRCLIVDAHSFPPEPLSVHTNQYPTGPTADICLGTDREHTGPDLLAWTRDAFGDHGLTVSVDTPFSGTVVPIKHLHRDRRVQSIMIEINRRLYLDASTGGRTDSFGRTRTIVQSVMDRLSRWIIER